jgi:magnesium chelatase subunit D
MAAAPQARAETPQPELDAWALACNAAQLFAIDPAGCGVLVLRAQAGPVRERWLALLHALLPATVPIRRLPLHVTADRLLGGLDLAATLQQGRPVVQRGVLAETDGGVLVVPMAERMSRAMVSSLIGVLDRGELVTETEGVSLRAPCRLGLVLLDESQGEGEQIAPVLLERASLVIDLSSVSMTDVAGELGDAIDRSRTEAARQRRAAPALGDELVQAACSVAAALGLESLRAPLQVLRVARLLAALMDEPAVDAELFKRAIQLSLLLRATRLPEPSADDAPQDAADPPPPPDQAPQDAPDEPPPDQPEQPVGELPEQVLEAAVAALPADLLARLKLNELLLRRRASAGRAGALQRVAQRGRSVGTRRGDPRQGLRLHLIDTLRAAAPWQRVRQAEGANTGRRSGVQVRPQDFRVHRYQQRRETTTVFLVDASGSSALHRLAEAKGAVELMLAECYVRRDRVAVLAFRGKGAEVLLPPTRSLVRAKRSLAGLPGGGGTPLASGLLAAAEVTESLRRQGQSVVLVVLTDGRANVGRTGQPGREQAFKDALEAAAVLAAQQLSALVVDTSPQPQALAEQLANRMQAAYLPLPHAGSSQLSAAVLAAQRAGGAA